MNRRSIATVTAVAAVVVLAVGIVRSPMPYVTMQPGPTVDVLGTYRGEPIVEVDGTRSYPPDGNLRLVTVSESTPDHSVLLPEALQAWFDKDAALIPRDAVYPDDATSESERALSSAQMVTSQDTAVAAALRRLGYHLRTFPEVIGLSPGGPSAGKLELRDRLRSIAGKPTPTLRSVFEALKGVEPGATVTVVVDRGSFADPTRKRLRITTVRDPDPANGGRALIGIFPGTGYRFPFKVSVGIDEGIGGPSAGLMFSLAIYDTLTPGDLTGGEDVAGTGTISDRGVVGAIGGIQQKIVGAQRDGATLFLVPPDNCADALGAPVDDQDIRLVKAPTLKSAINSLTAYAKDPDADLPRCTHD
ncbi:YlbL family protein [Nocardioides marmoribigeumensis]|uniref:endopeptidase La n=1 Tax=Nocardioides marmoribigeumensis TaxID=433649 RepID=A0ABU2BXJ9_9ACTN|nr:S16 family serine protease [Nocardioides marmoribigeumensis]MDR7363114.1 PDZ domain-containing protein [Nocardioides marmoribigeumensis]